MNDGLFFFGQATSLINLNSCNSSPTCAQSLPVAPGFAIPVCRAASLRASASELETISSAFRIKWHDTDTCTFVMAEAHKIVPSRARVNETSVDRAPCLRKSGLARSSRGHCAFSERLRHHYSHFHYSICYHRWAISGPEQSFGQRPETYVMVLQRSLHRYRWWQPIWQIHNCIRKKSTTYTTDSFKRDKIRGTRTICPLRDSIAFYAYAR
jgi:hypothetical protein